MARVDIFERRSWNHAPLVIVIGPGGSGKSTVSRLLAPMIGRAWIDLDQAFGSRIGPIDDYIQARGYLAYKAANSHLADDLVSRLWRPTLLTTSSGFLSLDNPEPALSANRRMLARGYSLSLLPAAERALASDIIVERQMRRSFCNDPAKEYRTIRERFDLYKAAGDMLVISAASPREIARAIAARLAPGASDAAARDEVEPLVRGRE